MDLYVYLFIMALLEIHVRCIITPPRPRSVTSDPAFQKNGPRYKHLQLPLKTLVSMAKWPGSITVHDNYEVDLLLKQSSRRGSDKTKHFGAEIALR